jgi:class 3 adenylate cyclase
VFGDGVNTASRMQAVSTPMQITASEQTYEIIKKYDPLRAQGPG